MMLKKLSITICTAAVFCINRRSYCLTVEEIYNRWNDTLEKQQVPEAALSARIIINHVLKSKMMTISEHILKNELNEQQVSEIDRLCECRLARMPVQYIIGEWDFRDLTLKLTPPVFIPRPETEMFIDIVIQNTHNPKNLLEIGCGSGCISISLLKAMPQVKVVAVEQNPLACKVAGDNAQLNAVQDRLTIIEGKLENDGTLKGIEQYSFDAIVSNPPYILTSEISELDLEVKLYEDIRALDGGSDGLQVIKAILLLSARILNPGSSCFLETHHSHLQPVNEWLQNHPDLKLKLSKSFKDFANLDRFLQIVKN